MRRFGDGEWDDDRPLGAAPAEEGRSALARLLEREGERRFLFAPVLFGGGILLFFGLRHDPSFAALATISALAAAAVALCRPASVARHLAAALLLVACGAAAASVRTATVDAPVVPEALGVAEVEGWVEAVERDPAAGDRIRLSVLRIAELEPDATPGRVAFRSRVAGAEYQAGTLVRVRAVLLPPPDAARPGGFDYARQAFFMGLGGTGYAVARPEVIEGQARGPARRAEAAIERLREAIANEIRAAMSPVAAAVAIALVTGQRSEIPEETEEALRASGLAHILSISGLHMMLVVGAIFGGVRSAAALVPAVALTQPVKKWAAALAILGGTGYLLISGGSVATQRAYIMALVLMIAVLADRPAITMRNIALAALAILIFRPEAVMTAGFQMSFAATVALVAAYEGLRERRAGKPPERVQRRGPLGHAGRYVGGILLTSVVAGAATAPYAAYHFQRVATYGLLGNLLALPIFGVLVMPFGLVGTLLMPFGLDWPFLWVMGQGIELTLWSAEQVAALPGANRAVQAFGPTALLLMTGGGLWLMLWRSRWRYLGIAGLAAGFMLAPLAPQPDLFIGRAGATVAARNGDQVVIVGRRGSDYEREDWLSAWGYGSETPTGKAACDAAACFHAHDGWPVSVVFDPAAFVDDCALARVVVALPEPPAWCRESALVVAGDELKRSGAIALRKSGERQRPSLRLETASGRTGERPWNWRWRAYGPPSLPKEWRPAESLQ